jgi:uncharacterized protein HemX
MHFHSLSLRSSALNPRSAHSSLPRRQTVAGSSSSHGPSTSSHLRAQQLLEKAIDCVPAAALAAAGGLVAMIYRLDQGQTQLKASQQMLEQQLKASQQMLEQQLQCLAKVVEEQNQRLEQQLQCLAKVVEEQNQGIKALIEERDKVFLAKMDLLEEKMVSKFSSIENLYKLKGHR